MKVNSLTNCWYQLFIEKNGDFNGEFQWKFPQMSGEISKSAYEMWKKRAYKLCS